MEFGCSICGYTSSQKINVVNHINRKRSCGPGIKEIIEIPVEIKCDFCSKTFSTKQNLSYHIKNSCKKKDVAKDARIKELEEQLKEAKQVTNITNNNTTIDI